MKTQKHSSNTIIIENESGRGRKPLELKLPKTKHFTIDKMVSIQKNPVTPVTVRNRLKLLEQLGKIEVTRKPNEGRGHPTYIYTLVA